MQKRHLEWIRALAKLIGARDARRMQLEQTELTALFARCAIFTWSGDLDHAIDVGEQGCAMSEARGELWVRGFLLNSLAQANWARGDRDRGEALAREAAVCKHALDDRWGLTLALETLAWMAAGRGDHPAGRLPARVGRTGP